MTDISDPAASLSPQDLLQRYQLINRVTRRPDAGTALQQRIAGLTAILERELTDLARQGSPDDFADIYFSIQQELERFQEFCAFPALSRKTTIAFGGSFSAGKSSLINAILGKRLLVTEVDPTTSLPTYLMQGSEEQIIALNLFRHPVSLSLEEFVSLTHDEALKYGSHVAQLLDSAIITHPAFAWRNLAFIDTPGYSKPDDSHHSARTDARVAHAQLNAAQAIVWVVSAESGNITEADLEFLGQLDRAIPRIVVVSRADKRPPEDIQQIVALVDRTLKERGMAALAVVPVSARKPAQFPVAPLLEAITAFDAHPRPVEFARRFKLQFIRYERYLQERTRRANLHLNRLNRILALADSTDIAADTEELRNHALYERDQARQQQEQLQKLTTHWFSLLKQVGDQFGIALPEPDAVALLNVEGVNLLTLLQQERQRLGLPAPHGHPLWSNTAAAVIPPRRAQLLRRPTAKLLTELLNTNSSSPPPRRDALLRRSPGTVPAALTIPASPR